MKRAKEVGPERTFRMTERSSVEHKGPKKVPVDCLLVVFNEVVLSKIVCVDLSVSVRVYGKVCVWTCQLPT